MGYLPIILAVIGFVFLWGVVNYHSLKNRRHEVEEASELLYRYAALRQNILIQLANIDNDDRSLKTFLSSISSSLKNIDKEETTAADVIADGQILSQRVDELTDQLGKDRKYRTSIEQLQKADFAYRVAANRYTLKFKQYHELLTKPPSKFIALIFGFSAPDHHNQASEVTFSS